MGLEGRVEGWVGGGLKLMVFLNIIFLWNEGFLVGFWCVCVWGGVLCGCFWDE